MQRGDAVDIRNISISFISSPFVLYFCVRVCTYNENIIFALTRICRIENAKKKEKILRRQWHEVEYENSKHCLSSSASHCPVLLGSSTL